MKTIISNILNAMVYANVGNLSEFKQVLHQDEPRWFDSDTLERGREGQRALERLDATPLLQV